MQERMPRVTARPQRLSPPRQDSKHGPAVLDHDPLVAITDSTADREHGLTASKGLHRSASPPSSCTRADSNACSRDRRGLGEQCPALDAFLGQIRKKTEVMGSDPTISGLFDSSPGPAGPRLWLIPCPSARCFCTYPKPQPRTKRPVSHRAAACHVGFPCQKPELHPTVGEKGKGEKSSAETHQTPNNISPQQNKALGNLFSACVPRPT